MLNVFNDSEVSGLCTQIDGVLRRAMVWGGRGADKLNYEC